MTAVSAEHAIGAEVRVAIVDNSSGLDALQGEWNALFETSPSAAPPLRWKWVREWWTLFGPVYGDRGTGLRILCVRRGSQLIGILPLYEGWKRVFGVRLRRLTSISDGAAEFEETSVDYLHLLHAPGEEAACVEAIAATLSADRRLRWDELELRTMSHASQLASLADTFRKPGFHVELTQPFHCFLFDMRKGFDDYLSRLSSSKLRGNSRRLLKKAAAAGMDFEVARDGQQADIFFDQMVELHRRRWQSRGKAGSFAPRHATFHRTLAHAGAATGEVIVARLSDKGTPMALVYGHRVGEHFCSYQQGVDTTVRGGVYSPGTAVYLLLARYLAEKGVTLFDLQKGPNPFKEQYCTDSHKLINLRVTRNTMRSRAFTVANFCQRALRKAMRMLTAKKSENPGPAAESSHDSNAPEKAESKGPEGAEA